MSTTSPIRSSLAAQVAAQHQAAGKQSDPSVPVSPALSQAPIGPRAVAPAEELRQWATLTQSGVTGLRNSMLTIAYYGYKVCAAKNWSALGIAGVDSETSWREHLGLSAKVWREHMILGSRISHLPIAELSSLTIATSQQLALIHPRIWTEYPWLDEARLLRPQEFAELVADRNSSLQSATIQIVEPTAKLSFQLPDSQRRDLNRRLTRLRRVHACRSQAAALEFAIAQAEQSELAETRQQEIESLMRELELVWLDVELRETESEREARLTAGPEPQRSLLSAAQRTCALLARMNRYFTKGDSADAQQADRSPSSSDPA